MRLTNQDIRVRFMNHQAGSQDAVDVLRRIRELAAAFSVELNEMLVEGEHKEEALKLIESAQLYATKAVHVAGIMAEQGGDFV